MDPSFKDKKLLVVGAGGIGCELLKNLVLTGFTQIDVIDLDTIELSNLNRQFLFQKHHVGKPKSVIARESVLKYACAQKNGTEIRSYHDSIMSPKYSVDFFRQFALVLNALDNKAARSHVNRLCLAADVPLIESGSAGYLGQVTLISRGLTECYDCLPKAPAKTFPGCTIRNTPSEPIHCIVWAKHLFNQLFGAEDPDEAVSPDGHDPENMAEAGQNALADSEQEKQRVSTRQWAKDTKYNPQKLFNKLFNDDIKYLLSMSKLWEKRKPPSPLVYAECESSSHIPGVVNNGVEKASSSSSSSSSSAGATTDFASLKLWTLGECVHVFEHSVEALSARLATEALLHWDKDDECALDFVVSAANLRSAVFGIAQKSKFEVKSLAGNIIPAIASTNAIVAGLIVIQALKVLAGALDQCRTVYLRDKPLLNRLIVSSHLEKPNPKCYVCAAKPELAVRLDLNKFTIKQLETKLLKQELNMIQPDVEIDDGSGRIIISSEEGETEENNEKVLSFFGITDQTRLKCDDFFQNYELRIVLHHSEKAEGNDAKDYEIISDMQTMKEIQEALQKETSKQIAADEEKKAIAATAAAGGGGKKRKLDEDDENTNGTDIIIDDTPAMSLSSSSNDKRRSKRSYEAAFVGSGAAAASVAADDANSILVEAAASASSTSDEPTPSESATVELAAKKMRAAKDDDTAAAVADNSDSINDASDIISDVDDNNSNSISRPSFSSMTNQSSSVVAAASSRGAAGTIVEESTTNTTGAAAGTAGDDDEIIIEDDEDDDCIIEEEEEEDLVDDEDSASNLRSLGLLPAGEDDESNEYVVVSNKSTNNHHNEYHLNGGSGGTGDENTNSNLVNENGSSGGGGDGDGDDDDDIIECASDQDETNNDAEAEAQDQDDVIEINDDDDDSASKN